MTRQMRAPRADGELTSKRILEAAGELIAARGFAATTNIAIAKHAQVDHASINYHYGSRAKLYQAVLTEAHRRVIRFEDLQVLATSLTEPREKLRQFITLMVQATKCGPQWHARVLNRELLSRSLTHQEAWFQEISGKQALVLGILSEITQIPASDPALHQCLISISVPVTLLIGEAHDLLEMDDLVISAAALIDHLYTFAIGGLEAVSQTYHQRVIVSANAAN